MPGRQRPAPRRRRPLPMAPQGDGGAGQARAEAEAEAEARGGGGCAEPLAEAGGGHGGLTEDGAERKGRVSGQLSSRLPVLLQRGGRRAEQRYPPSRPAAAASLVDGDSRQTSRARRGKRGRLRQEAGRGPGGAALRRRRHAEHLPLHPHADGRAAATGGPAAPRASAPCRRWRRGCVRVVALPFGRAVSVPACEELLLGLRGGTPYGFDLLV